MSERDHEDCPSQYLPSSTPGMGNSGFKGRTNTLAVLALALSVVAAPLGILFGVLGLKQVARRGEAGRGFALAGLIIGGCITIVGATAIVAVAVMGRHAESSAASSPPATTSHFPEATATESRDMSISLACQEIVPAIKNTATELQHDLSTNAAVDQINNMMSQINSVARGTGDTPFEMDVAAAGAAMSVAVDDVSTTGTADFGAVGQAIRRVAADCAPYVPLPPATSASSAATVDSAAPSQEAATARTSVSVLFEFADWDTATNNCVGVGSYSDLHPGTPVALLDRNGVALGSSSLGQGQPGTGGGCSFIVRFANLPAAVTPYELKVGQRDALTLSAADQSGVEYDFSAALTG